MKILGLDISTKSTGWFITKSSCGVIKTGDKLNFDERLVSFREQLNQILSKYRLDLVIIEDAYYRPGFGSIHTLKALVKFAGVAQELCAGKNLRTEIITATMARKHCCGEQEGKFKKPEVFKFFVDKEDFDKVCQRLYNRPCNFKTDNDLTDAAALSRAGRVLFTYGDEKSVKKKSNKKKKK